MYVCVFVNVTFAKTTFGVEHTSTAVVSPGQAKGRRAPAPPRGKAPARRRGEGPSKRGLERIGRT